MRVAEIDNVDNPAVKPGKKLIRVFRRRIVNSQVSDKKKEGRERLQSESFCLYGSPSLMKFTADKNAAALTSEWSETIRAKFREKATLV